MFTYYFAGVGVKDVRVEELFEEVHSFLFLY